MKTEMLTRLLLSCCLLCAILLISSCDDDDEPEIQYPEEGFYGPNLLMKGKTDYSAMDVSLRAWVPDGKKVKIVITGKTAANVGGGITGIWGNLSATSNNWAMSKFNQSDYTQTYQSIDGGHTCDLNLAFDKGTFQIDYYENGSTSPTATKTVVFSY